MRQASEQGVARSACAQDGETRPPRSLVCETLELEGLDARGSCTTQRKGLSHLESHGRAARGSSGARAG